MPRDATQDRSTRRAAERIQNRGPEPVRVLFVAVDGYERDATNVRRAVGPRAQ